jgi:hypothetical protein
MAQLNNVRPGDLIRAEDWNALVAAVEGLSGQVQPGGVVVPNLFGMTLNTAAAIIRLPSSQLNLGSVLNSYGESVDPNSPDTMSLLVLAQSPGAGISVTTATALNLMVSPTPGSPSSAVQQVVVGVAESQPAPGYDPSTNTASFNHGTTLGAVVFQVFAPNVDLYNCTLPQSVGGGAWGASFATNQSFQGAGGNPVRVSVKIQPIPAGPASTSLSFGVASQQHPNLFANMSVTLKVL